MQSMQILGSPFTLIFFVAFSHFAASAAAAASAEGGALRCSPPRLLRPPPSPTACQGPALVLSLIGARCEAAALPPHAVSCRSPSVVARILPPKCSLESDGEGLVIVRGVGRRWAVWEGAGRVSASIRQGSPALVPRPHAPISTPTLSQDAQCGPAPQVAYAGPFTGPVGADWPGDLAATPFSAAGVAAGLYAALSVGGASAGAAVAGG